jgi:hypothetical protein
MNCAPKPAYLTYDDYENKKGVNFPTRRTISVAEKKKLDIKLNFKQYDFNETLSFPSPCLKVTNGISRIKFILHIAVYKRYFRPCFLPYCNVTMIKKILLTLLIALGFFSFVQAQSGNDKAQLEKERQDIQKELQEIQDLYNKVKGQTKQSLSQLNMLKRKINLQVNISIISTGSLG